MNTTSTADPEQRDLVIRHLQLLGSLEVTTGPSLPLGIDGVRLESDGALSLDGCNLITTECRLSHLLDVDPEFRYLVDPVAATELYRSGQDPLLYRAVRRFLPSRSLISRDLVVAGEDDAAQGLLIADLVVYEPGVLPGGEPFRSTGHWNLPGQLEIFQVLSGRIAMLVAGHNRSGEAFAYVQICPAGTTMAVPFDVWHVSYVLDGPAVVFNVSAQLQETGFASTTDKYHRAKAVELTLKRQPDLAIVGDADTVRQWGPLGGAPATDWFTDLLAPSQSLADLHLHGSPEQFSAVVRAAMNAHNDGWPTGCLTEYQNR